MRSFLVTKVYSAYDIEVNIKLLILWQLKEKGLWLIYSPKLEEVQRAQSYYISEEWSIQRMISVNIPLFIFTGRRHNFFSQGLKDETCRSCLMNRLKQSAFLNCFTPKSLVGSLCPWTTIEATVRNHSHPLLTNCQIPSSSCSAQQDIILKIKFTL